MKVENFSLVSALAVLCFAGPAAALDITPRNIASFTTACRGKTVAPSPRQVEGQLVFNALTGGQQLDPQVAVGGGHVLNAANTGVALFTKAGEFVGAGNPSCLNGEIDPKIFFDPFSKRFVYASISFSAQARIAVSKTSDPREGWWAYSIPVPGWVDGGAVGGNKKWLTYSYPASGGQGVFLLDREKVMAGAAVTVVDLGKIGNPGQPVFTYDADQENLYFVKLAGGSIQVNYVTATGQLRTQAAVSHNLGLSYPTAFPQRGTGSTSSAGDINAKMAVLRNGSIWTCDAATTRAGGVTRTVARFYQVDLAGKIVQTAAVDDPTGTVYSGQVTIAVNKRDDVLLVFQQSGRNMFVGSRMSYRLAADPAGTLRPFIKHAEGLGANTSTPAWGDYSGASVDGDNDLDMWGINSVANSGGSGNSVIFRLELGGGSGVLAAQAGWRGLSVRQAAGSLLLSGPGLGEGSRLEIFGANGASLARGAFSPGGGGTGKFTVATSRLPKGPVFLRLQREGRFEDLGWVSLHP